MGNLNNEKLNLLYTETVGTDFSGEGIFGEEYCGEGIFREEYCGEGFPGEEIFREEFSEEDLSEEELQQELADIMVSQQQGNWLDGYLDAMEELEEEG